MATISTQQTEAVLEHHLRSIDAKDVDAIIQDYAEDAVLFSPEATLRGKAELRTFFTRLVEGLTQETSDNFKMLRQDVVGETAYIFWKVDGSMPMGTDTFVVRDGKIVTQTLSAYVPNA